MHSHTPHTDIACTHTTKTNSLKCCHQEKVLEEKNQRGCDLKVAQSPQDPCFPVQCSDHLLGGRGPSLKLPPKNIRCPVTSWRPEGHRRTLQVRCLSRWLGLSPQPLVQGHLPDQAPRLLNREALPCQPSVLRPWPWFLGSPRWRIKQGHTQGGRSRGGCRANPRRVCTHPGMGNRFCSSGIHA